MFESADDAHQVDASAFEEQQAELRERLLELQFTLAERKSCSVLLLLTGMDGAGKSAALARLYTWLDAHQLQTTAFADADEAEAARPWMWRYWRRLPPKGTIGVFFGSWYRDPLLARLEGDIDDAGFEARLATTNRFEAMLANEGALLIKVWLHLSEKQTRKRGSREIGKARRLFEYGGWRKHYPELLAMAQVMARLTSTPWAPWMVVPSANPEYRDLAIGRMLAEALERRLLTGAPPPVPVPLPVPEPAPPATAAGAAAEAPLAGLDLGARLERSAYKAALTEEQSRLATLTDSKAFRRIAVVAAFEGNAAAGRDGAIRRLTMAIDPRRFIVHAIAAPTDEEREQPYLWRFWRRLPAKGNVSIFRRSWYDRVLAERVEGLCSEADWRRAYGEINDFEAELSADRVVVVKFWLAISADEQLRRFQTREGTPFKRYKVAPEDWRNREKAPEYAQAASEMIEGTSTAHAPWTLVAAEDSNHARVTVLRALCERIEAAI